MALKSALIAAMGCGTSNNSLGKLLFSILKVQSKVVIRNNAQQCGVIFAQRIYKIYHHFTL